MLQTVAPVPAQEVVRDNLETLLGAIDQARGTARERCGETLLRREADAIVRTATGQDWPSRTHMLQSLPHPLPWYLAGPLIGLVVPALLLIGNKPFGVSSNFRHLCAALGAGRIEFFSHDWKTLGSWNLVFLSGIFAGAFTASQLAPPLAVTLAPHTVTALGELGLHDLSGMAPRELFAWASLFTVKGFVLMVGGGFLVGFGTAYAGGCTSGHAIAGLADLQLPSLIAVCGFFGGGLLATHLLLPLLLGQTP